VIVCLLPARTLLLSAQQRTWPGSFAVEYGSGAGPAFSGKGAVWKAVAAFRGALESVISVRLTLRLD